MFFCVGSQSITRWVVQSTLTIGKNTVSFTVDSEQCRKVKVAKNLS